MIISMVFRMIRDFHEEKKILPPVLFLNMDNCGRENKVCMSKVAVRVVDYCLFVFQNRFLLSFLSSLVDLGVFREIVLYFLLVGHTGNSVDQLFSILTQEFKKSEIKTLEELEEIIIKSPMSPKPEVERLIYIWDWKQFISGHFSEKDLHNHSFYSAFSIVKEDGITKLRVKRLPQDKVWFPPTGIELIKQNINFEPIGSADFRIENLNIPKIMCDLLKYFQRMPTHIRVSVSDSWLKLREVLEGLPKKQKNFPTMKITELPRITRNAAAVELPDEYVFVNNDRENLPEISGKVCELGLFASVVKQGLDVVVYTKSLVGRPWVGRVEEVFSDETFSIQWFDRLGKSNRFRAMKKADKTPYISKLDNSVVMFWDISVQRTDDSFYLSPYWLNKVTKEYEIYDKTRL